MSVSFSVSFLLFWICPDIRIALTGNASHIDEITGVSWRRFQECIPQRTVDGRRMPVGFPGQLQYAGISVWNSHGLDFHGMLRAMLGDDTAFWETPLFTAFKLKLLGLESRIPYAIPPSSTEQSYSARGPFFAFLEQAMWPSWKQRLKAWAPGPATEKSYRGAVFRAKTLIDSYFRQMDDADIIGANLAPEYEVRYARKLPASMGGYSGPRCKMVKTSDIVGSQDPYDAYFSIVFPEIAQHPYGPNLVVFQPDEADARGVDLSEYRCAHFKNRCCNVGVDNGEILTPGYAKPESIAGFEVRSGDTASRAQRWDKDHPGHGSDFDVKSIEVAFYKHRGDGTSSKYPFVIVLTPVKGVSSSCIAINSAKRFVGCEISYRKRNRSWELTTDEAWPCNPDYPVVHEHAYVPILGLLYSVQGLDGQEMDICAAAERALAFHRHSSQHSYKNDKALSLVKNFLFMDQSLRFLRLGEKCGSRTRGPSQQLRSSAKLPKDSPPGFADFIGIERHQQYVRGYTNLDSLQEHHGQDMEKKEKWKSAHGSER